MRNYIILNEKNSNEIAGLLIQNLPPISKPLQRTLVEEIDGRDGDIVTKLGYGAYDKEFSIGLYGSYDVDQVISYFNSEGVVTFSNEPDKYYNYQIIDQIDFERLIRFKTATVRMHVQPFKYLKDEEQIQVDAQNLSGEGTDIKLEYTTKDASLKIEPKGNTHQDSYTGKNLLSKQGFSTPSNDTSYWDRQYDILTPLENGWGRVVINDSSSSQRWFNLFIKKGNIDLEPNTQYTFVVEIKNVSGFAAYKLSQNNDGEAWSGNIDANMNVTTQQKFLNQTKSDFSNVTFDLRTFLTLPANKTGTIDIRMMILKGDYTNIDIDYEPFVGGIPSPNPDFPQPIRVVTGDNTINVHGKNLLNVSDSYSVTLYQDTNIYLEPGNYVMSFDSITTDVTVGTSSLCNFYHNDNTFDQLYLSHSNKVGQITITAPVTKVRIYSSSSYNNSNGKTTTFTNLMIEKGSTATEYQPYQSKDYEISLGNIELCKIGTYQDYIYKENNKWYLHKEIGKIDFGTITWDSDGHLATGYRRYYTNTIPNVKYVSSNTQLGVGLAEKYKIHTGNGMSSYGAENCFAIDVSIVQAVDQASPTGLFYYALATPTDTEITDTDLIEQLEALDQAKTIEETTYISSSSESNLPFLLTASAKGMNNTIIENIGNIFAKPIITIYGSGEVAVYLDKVQILQIDLADSGSITIDVSKLEAYNKDTNELMNRSVIGDYSNLKIQCGENELTFSGNVTGFTMDKYTRWL